MNLNNFKAGVVFFQGTGFLSDVIAKVSGDKKATGEVPTHCALIEPPRAFPGYDLTKPVKIFESTKEAGKDGPEVNDLESRIEGYDKKGNIWVCEFTDKVFAAIDWKAATAFMLSRAGDQYNVLELPADLLHLKLGFSNHKEVCSELVLETLYASGIQSHTPSAYQSNPQELAELPLFKSCTQVFGEPATLRGFKVS